MPGPPPKHPSARARTNNPKKDFTTLTAAGLQKPAPEWPLQPDPLMLATKQHAEDRVSALQQELADCTDGRAKGRLNRELAKQEMQIALLSIQLEQAKDAEVELWDALWAMPQAVMWDEAHAHREVAQYVRWKIRAEQGDLKAAGEARQWSDRLGLNPLALLRLRVEIEQAEAAEDRGRQRRSHRTPAPKKRAGGDPRDGLYAV